MMLLPRERILAAYADYQQLDVLAPLRAQSPFVPGSGPLNAPLLLVGEAPGAQEVEQGEPFVGRSGRLLNTLLTMVGIPRRYCYVTNVLLYRPPGNRTPERFEIAASRERLLTEIEAVQPVLVITLGAVARRALKPQGDPVSICHGKPEPLGFVHNVDYQRGDPIQLEAEVTLNCMMLPTFHPAAALRDPAVHAMMREDLRFLERFREDDRAAGDHRD
jgi:uracil-DNA glycosylase